MGKTYRKDGSNRNKYYVKSKKNQKKFTINDYKQIINDYEEDNFIKELIRNDNEKN